MRKINLSLSLIFFLLAAVLILAGFKNVKEEKAAPLSDQTQECLDCHQTYTPGIVEDWLQSEHAHQTPSEALKKQELEREVSSQSIPPELMEVAVGCYECHGRHINNHQDSFEHFDFKINVVVSPTDCSTCHSQEEKQYSKSKKAHALDNLQQNSVYHTLVESITSLKEIKEGKPQQLQSSPSTKAETCYACHGTRIEVKGLTTVETELGEISLPELTNWPNQGVGRVNPDGSRGSCTACHPRHSFSVEIARKPETCSQCHLEPDVPAWNVYRESKHGNIYYSKGQDWNWEHIPWVVGQDFKAPTCASCHNSLLVDTEGLVIAERTHDFGSRLWIRIFGLIYSHPQPKNGQTYLIKNKDGLPLPTSFDGQLARPYLIEKSEQEKRKIKMKRICQTCHSSLWAQEHFTKLGITVKETDKMVLAATQLLLTAWEKGLADKNNPFDEALEQRWIKQWLFYANSIRYASAMAGPDFAAFKNGWFELTKNLQEMKDSIEIKLKNKQDVDK